MKKQANRKKFIELRAKRVTFAEIREKLGITEAEIMEFSKDKDLRLAVGNRQTIEEDKLQERYSINWEKRVELLGGELSRIKAEAEKRDLSKVKTETLLTLLLKFTEALKAEKRAIKFSEEVEVSGFNMEDLGASHKAIVSYEV